MVPLVLSPPPQVVVHCNLILLHRINSSTSLLEPWRMPALSPFSWSQPSRSPRDNKYSGVQVPYSRSSSSSITTWQLFTTLFLFVFPKGPIIVDSLHNSPYMDPKWDRSFTSIRWPMLSFPLSGFLMYNNNNNQSIISALITTISLFPTEIHCNCALERWESSRTTLQKKIQCTP